MDHVVMPHKAAGEPDHYSRSFGARLGGGSRIRITGRFGPRYRLDQGQQDRKARNSNRHDVALTPRLQMSAESQSALVSIITLQLLEAEMATALRLENC